MNYSDFQVFMLFCFLQKEQKLFIAHILAHTLAQYLKKVDDETGEFKGSHLNNHIPVSAFCPFLFFKLPPFENESQIKCHNSSTFSSAILNLPTWFVVCSVSRDKQLSASPKMHLHTKDISTECIIGTYKEYLNVCTRTYTHQKVVSYSATENLLLLQTEPHSKALVVINALGLTCLRLSVQTWWARGCVSHHWVGNNCETAPSVGHSQGATAASEIPWWQPICFL